MSQHLPSLRPAQVLRVLRQEGFYVHHIKGSHYILKHPKKGPLRVTLPMHGSDLKRRTLTSIIDQAGFTVDEFVGLL